MIEQIQDQSRAGDQADSAREQSPVLSPQSSDISVHPRASEADQAQGSRLQASGVGRPPVEAGELVDLEDIRELAEKRSRLRGERDPRRFRDYADPMITFVAINIATRTLRDEIRELEIRRSRGLPPSNSATEVTESTE